MRMFLGLFATALLLMVEHADTLIPNCDFFDTANITTAQKLSNGSYLYENLVIPVHLTGEYDYKLLPDYSKKKVKSHLRGCVCKLKPCVRICCPYNYIMVDKECLKGTEEDMDSLNPFLNLTLNNGSVVKRHLINDFIVQLDVPLPCERKFYLDSGYEADKYTLFENGTFKRNYDRMFMNKSEYCMQHFKFKDSVHNTTFIQIAALNCPTEQSKTGKTAQTVVMIISLFCMLLTIKKLVVEKLQNLHGKCFICYIFSIFMGYLLLLLNFWRLSDGFCLTSGYLGYFFVMAALLWLSVISLHLWNMFSGNSHTYLANNCYAWGMAAVLTGVTYLADKFVENEDWNPRLGQYEQCWIYTREWSAMLYFYGPILLLIVFNIIMFTLTAVRIMKERRDIQDFANNPDRNHKLNSDKQRFTFFLQLFIIMGLNWILEIILYLIQNKPWSKELLVADYINWSQGLIIFVLFIMKPNKLKLLRERSIKGGSEESEPGDSKKEISLANMKIDPNVLK